MFGKAIPLFPIMGIPISVSPFFFLLIFFLSIGSDSAIKGVIFGVVAILSILIHEFGHALVAKASGLKPRVTLTAFGGVTEHSGIISTKRLMLLTIMGPVAGYLFALAAWGFSFLLDLGNPNWATNNPHGALVIFYIILVNVIWSTFNLFPVLPLDGGHLLRQFLDIRLHNRVRSLKLTSIVSIAGSGVLLVIGIVLSQAFLILISLYFAYMNYMIMRQVKRGAQPDQFGF